MKKAADLVAVKRKDGRYAVRRRGGGFVNGADKANFLADAGHIKLTAPAPKEEPAEEAPAEEAASEEAAE